MFVHKTAALLTIIICFTLSNNTLGSTMKEQIGDESKKRFPVIEFNPDLQNTMTTFKWNTYKNQALNRLTDISRGPDVTPPNPSGAAKSAIHENNGINEQAVVAYNDMATNYNSDPEYYYDLIRGIANGEEDTTSDYPEDSSSSSLPVNDYASTENTEQPSPNSGEA